jgi:hypothetical protein
MGFRVGSVKKHVRKDLEDLCKFMDFLRAKHPYELTKLYKEYKDE